MNLNADTITQEIPMRKTMTHNINNKVAALVVGLFVLAQLASSQAAAEPRLNGLAVHSELGKERFIAGLFLTTPSNSARDILIAQEDKRIQVRIVADRISARSFKRMWIEGMAINASSSELSENAQRMADFSNMLKMRLVTGDIFTVDRRGDNVYIILNGVTLGEIDSPAFFDLLLRTWIGPVPLSSDFRDGLLAAGNINSALQARFDATFPTDERIAAVEANVSARPTEEPRVAAVAPPAAATALTQPPPPLVEPQSTDVAVAPTVAPPTATEPQVAAATPTPTPRPTPAPTPEPTVEKQTPASVTQQALLDVDELEEEEEDVDFTAESLLRQQLYIADLKKWSHKFLEYPRRALERSWQGNVRLSVTVDRSGAVQDVIVLEESKYSTLTKAAVKAAKQASPFPEMPTDIQGKEFSFTLPVVFKLRN